MFIAVLITCHNRKDKTLQCLNLLFKQNGIDLNFKIKVFLVDDGSIDGTSIFVKKQFPEVNIIKGTGNLYWNRGMILAWKESVKFNDFDYYLCLNDDTFLLENAIIDLISNDSSNHIISGTTKSMISFKFTYGGVKNETAIIPNGYFQECDYANGNILLISRYAFKKIGYFDDVFQHALGDLDYTLRAKFHGIKVFVAPNWSGYCERHLEEPIWVRDSNVIRRFKNLYSPLSGCAPNEFFIFDKRHNGITKAIFHFFTINFRCLAPKIYNLVNPKI